MNKLPDWLIKKRDELANDVCMNHPNHAYIMGFTAASELLLEDLAIATKALDFYVTNVYNENRSAMPECFEKAEQALTKIQGKK